MRTLFRALILITALGAASLPALPATAAPTVTVDSLTISADSPTAGRPITATANVRASEPLRTDVITIAVRDAAGQIVDFPGARPAALGTGRTTFTSDPRSYPPGRYTYFFAYLAGGVWTDLAPRQSFTVTAADNPVTFSQDFDGPAGAGPNHGLSTPVWFNDPCWRQACTGTIAEYKMDHARLDGKGNLVLTADDRVTPGARCGTQDCRYATARLTMIEWDTVSRVAWSQTGGRLEVRMKAPLGKGLWPAFWTVGHDNPTVPWPRSGEIDVVEIRGDHPTLAEQHAHGGDPYRHFGGSATIPGGGRVDGFHTYAVDWDAGPDGYLKWSVDGVVTRTLTAAQAGTSWEQSYRHAHTLILNLAVGGPEWVGLPDASTRFPAELVVDHVRAYQKPML
jgi:hypothetical protein